MADGRKSHRKHEGDHRSAAQRSQVAGGEPAEAPAAATDELSDRIAQLESALAEAETERDTYLDHLRRLQAEFDNYRKRVDRELATHEERIVDHVLLDLLPVFDNMQRAFANHSDGEEPARFIDGMERIFAQFAELLKQHDVAPIDAVGEAFDPQFHEALLVVASDRPKNVVVEEFERGYRRQDRVLRPSKVKVSGGSDDDKKEIG